MKSITSCYRASTFKQHRTGLGLQAQRGQCLAFAKVNDFEVISSYQGASLGGGYNALNQRSSLANTIRRARIHNYPILTIKLDILSRNVVFIAGPMKEKAPFIVAELSLDVNSFQLHLWRALKLILALTRAEQQTVNGII